MEFFDKVGAVIEQRWKEENYLESAFPKISAEVLDEADAVGNVDPWEIIADLQTVSTLPEQQTDTFSDLALTLYRASRFGIDVYFWLDSTTSIHQHSFSGAFQVLAGSSVHSIYHFKLNQLVNAHFSIGEIVLGDVQILNKGDIRKIRPGRPFIHSLFHLDRPSVTITVRTRQDPNALPQYSYLKPYFAFNPAFSDPVTSKKLQSAVMLLRLRDPGAYNLLDELISLSDFQTTFLILDAAYNQLINHTRGRFQPWKENKKPPDDFPDEKERFLGLLRAARAKHGNLTDFVFPVLDETQRNNVLVNLRSTVSASEHRLFLGLLLNVESKDQLIDLVRQRFPDRDPVGCICTWVDELYATNKPGSNSSVLGIESFGQAHRFIFRQLLEGISTEELRIKAEEGDLEVSEAERASICHSFQRSIILKSILRNPSGESTGSPVRLPNWPGPKELIKPQETIRISPHA
jgi:hypothetical protein